MIKLRCEYLLVRCIWLYVLIMSFTRFRANPHSFTNYVVVSSESLCSHLNSRYHACLEQGVPWHSGNYGIWIHSETRTWHDKNIKSNAPYRWVLTIQLSHLASLTKWLSVGLQTNWLCVRVPLQSLSSV